MEQSTFSPTTYAHPELDEEKLLNQDSDEIEAPTPDTVIGGEDEEATEEEEDDDEEEVAGSDTTTNN